MLLKTPTIILVIILLFIVVLVVMLLIALGIIKVQEKEMGGEIKKEPGINKPPENDE
jgi:hypothetical protein